MRWHRSEGEVVPVVERHRMALGGVVPAPLTLTEYVVAVEQDTQATYVYIGPLEEAHRFLALTLDSARRLHAVLGGLLRSVDQS